jgi:hypothetical protein
MINAARVFPWSPSNGARTNALPRRTVTITRPDAGSNSKFGEMAAVLNELIMAY